MQFIPIKLEDLTAGQPLPWPLHYPTGDKALDSGFVPESKQFIESLVDRGLCRYLEDPDDDESLQEEGAVLDLPKQSDKPASKSETTTPKGDIHTLEQTKLKIGDSMQLQFQSDSKTERSFVTLIGYMVGQSVIVSTPVLNDRIMSVREGQIFVVRMFSGKSAYAFTATTNKVTNVPFPHMHLSYPKNVRGLVVRGSSRARTNIICHATLENGSTYACVARDISIGGALIEAKEKIGEADDKLVLKLRLKIHDSEHLLVLNCQIRSSNFSRVADEEAPTFMQGLSFLDLNSQDTLIISALLYQNIVSEQNLEH